MLYFNFNSETWAGLTCGDTVQPSTLNIYRSSFVWHSLILTVPVQNDISLYDAVAFHVSCRILQSQNLINMLLLLSLTTTRTKHFIVDNKHSFSSSLGRREYLCLIKWYINSSFFPLRNNPVVGWEEKYMGV